MLTRDLSRVRGAVVAGRGAGMQDTTVLVPVGVDAFAGPVPSSRGAPV